MAATSSLREQAEKHLVWVVGAATLAVAAFPFVAAGIEGNAVADNCSVRRTIGYLLSPSERPSSPSGQCESLPLLIDFPGLVLGLACVASVPIYWWFRRWASTRLRDEVIESGLYNTSDADQLTTFAHASAGRTRETKVVWLLSLLVVAVIDGWFINEVSDDYAWAAFIADHGGISESTVIHNWWAYWPSAPIGTIAWMTVGAVGAVHGLMHGWNQWNLTQSLRKARQTTHARFVFEWEKPDHGWGPMSGLLSASLCGALAYVAALGSSVYMAVGNGIGWVASVLITLMATWGIFVNAFMMRTIFTFVKSQHAEARSQCVERVRAELTDLRAGTTTVNRHVVARLLIAEMASLQTVRAFPVSGWWRRLPGFSVIFLANVAVLGSLLRWVVFG